MLFKVAVTLMECCDFHSVASSYATSQRTTLGRYDFNTTSKVERFVQRLPEGWLPDSNVIVIDTARIKDDWSKNLSTVKQLIIFDRPVKQLIIFDKIMNRLCPENLWNKFQRRSHYSNYNILGFVRIFKFQSITRAF